MEFRREYLLDCLDFEHGGVENSKGVDLMLAETAWLERHPSDQLPIIAHEIEDYSDKQLEKMAKCFQLNCNA